jgi:hypothetical protein
LLENVPQSYEPYEAPSDLFQMAFRTKLTAEFSKKLACDGVFITTKARLLFQEPTALRQSLIGFRSSATTAEVRDSLKVFRNLHPDTLYPTISDSYFLISGVDQQKLLAAAIQIKSKLSLVITEGRAHLYDSQLLSAVNCPQRVQGASPVVLAGPSHRWPESVLAATFRHFELEKSQVTHWVQLENGLTGLLVYVKEPAKLLGKPPFLCFLPAPAKVKAVQHLPSTATLRSYETKLEDASPTSHWNDWITAGKGPAPAVNPPQSSPRSSPIPPLASPPSPRKRGFSPAKSKTRNKSTVTPTKEVVLGRDFFTKTWSAAVGQAQPPPSHLESSTTARASANKQYLLPSTQVNADQINYSLFSSHQPHIINTHQLNFS